MNQSIASNPTVVRRGASRFHRAAQYVGLLADAIARVAGYVRRRLAELDESIARDREIREAIEHLEAMSDTQLRDIGITRADIADAVRFGRHYYLERDSE